MMNKKKGRPVIPLGDDDGLDEDKPKPPAATDDVGMSMLSRSEDNIDRNNIKPNQYADNLPAGNGNASAGESVITEDVSKNSKARKIQQSVTITVENQRKIKILSSQYGSSQTWIINAALENYFEAKGIR